MIRLVGPLIILALVFWTLFYEVTGKARRKVFKSMGRVYLVVLCAAILLFIGASFLGAIHGTGR